MPVPNPWSAPNVFEVRMVKDAVPQLPNSTATQVDFCREGVPLLSRKNPPKKLEKPPVPGAWPLTTPSAAQVGTIAGYARPSVT